MEQGRELRSVDLPARELPFGRLPRAFTRTPRVRSTTEVSMAQYRSTCNPILFYDQSRADIVELGVPFSDPLAEGPVIQESSFRALQNGTSSKVGSLACGTPGILWPCWGSAGFICPGRGLSR